MACFLVPAAEAVITTVAEKVIKHGEKKEETGKLRFSDKLKWLNGMLWGGSGLLAFEHIWHGEVVPYFPFLTNASDPDDRAEMLHEMMTSGVAMAALVTLVWVGMVIISSRLEKRIPALKEKTAEEGQI